MANLSYFDFPHYLGAGTKDALEKYWMWGCHPGSFTHALLAGDLYRASACADHSNRQVLADLAQWVYLHAPDGSFGNHQSVDSWLADKDQRRTKFSERKEKEYLLKVLSAKPKDFNNEPPF
jgi:hypothetical protein